MRRQILAAAAAVALTTVLAGCGGDDPATVTGAAATTTAAPAPATTTPAAPPAAATSAPTPAASASAAVPAAPATIPDDAMLQGPDWPRGAVREDTSGVGRLAQTEPSACQAKTAYPSDRQRRVARMVAITSDDPESGGVSQTVVVYAPGRATEAMAEMRRVLATCTGGYGTEYDMKRTYRLAGQKFLGDDSLLIRRADRPNGTDREYSAYISVVRLQDVLVTTSSELGEGVGDEALARRLADVGTRRAACLWKSC
jgi:hypothetical protein